MGPDGSHREGLVTGASTRVIASGRFPSVSLVLVPYQASRDEVSANDNKLYLGLQGQFHGGDGPSSRQKEIQLLRFLFKMTRASLQIIYAVRRCFVTCG